MSPNLQQKSSTMKRSLSALCTVLTALAMNALVATADFTFQTSPSSKQILSSNSGLAVRWDVQPGNSPDSNSAAPSLLTVSLGYRDASGSPQILFPPLNGVDSNVPLQSKEFTWAKIDFGIFTANKDGMPPLDVKSQFFVVLADQATGYRSNGQIFSIVSAPGAAPEASAPAASAQPSAPAASSSGASSAPPAAASPARPAVTGGNTSSPSGAAASQPPPATSTGSSSTGGSPAGGSSTGGSSPGGSSTGGSSAGGSSSGSNSNAPDADASSTSDADSSPVPGKGSDAPQNLASPISLRFLLTLNTVFGGVLACMILF